jgi:hypothetical protein
MLEAVSKYGVMRGSEMGLSPYVHSEQRNNLENLIALLTRLPLLSNRRDCLGLEFILFTRRAPAI